MSMTSLRTQGRSAIRRGLADRATTGFLLGLGIVACFGCGEQIDVDWSVRGPEIVWMSLELIVPLDRQFRHDDRGSPGAAFVLFRDHLHGDALSKHVVVSLNGRVRSRCRGKGQSFRDECVVYVQTGRRLKHDGLGWIELRQAADEDAKLVLDGLFGEAE